MFLCIMNISQDGKCITLHEKVQTSVIATRYQLKCGYLQNVAMPESISNLLHM